MEDDFNEFDLPIIGNNGKLCEFAEYWSKAADRLIHETAIETPVSFIVHSRLEVYTYLKEGQYFFSDSGVSCGLGPNCPPCRTK